MDLSGHERKNLDVVQNLRGGGFAAAFLHKPEALPDIIVKLPGHIKGISVATTSSDTEWWNRLAKVRDDLGKDFSATRRSVALSLVGLSRLDVKIFADALPNVVGQEGENVRLDELINGACMDIKHYGMLDRRDSPQRKSLVAVSEKIACRIAEDRPQFFRELTHEVGAFLKLLVPPDCFSLAPNEFHKAARELCLPDAIITTLINQKDNTWRWALKKAIDRGRCLYA